MKKIKISFIGVGFMSQIAHLINFYNNKNVELYDVADFDLKLAKKIKKFFLFSGIATEDYKKILKRNPDGIVIIVQRPLTNNIVKNILKQKINVLSEKPPSFSKIELSNCLKIQKNNKLLWYKGFNRRHDYAVNKLKNNFHKYSSNLGNLRYVQYKTTAGNTYRGKKHFILPSIKNKKMHGVKNKFPSWLPKRYNDLFHKHWNSSCHYLDLFEYYEFKNFTNIKTLINDNLYIVYFNSNFKKNKVLCNLTTINSKNNDWEEEITFYFERGKISINFNSPLSSGKSANLIIEDHSKNKFINLNKDNSWSFNNQSSDFVNDIQKRIAPKLEGLTSIDIYEKSWKVYLNLK